MSSSRGRHPVGFGLRARPPDLFLPAIVDHEIELRSCDGLELCRALSPRLAEISARQWPSPPRGVGFPPRLSCRMQTARRRTMRCALTFPTRTMLSKGPPARVWPRSCGSAMPSMAGASELCSPAAMSIQANSRGSCRRRRYSGPGVGSSPADDDSWFYTTLSSRV